MRWADKSVYARPHPGPLPRGEGVADRIARLLVRRICNLRHSVARQNSCAINGDPINLLDRQMVLPLLGERAGVRAVVVH